MLQELGTEIARMEALWQHEAESIDAEQRRERSHEPSELRQQQTRARAELDTEPAGASLEPARRRAPVMIRPGVWPLRAGPSNGVRATSRPTSSAGHRLWLGAGWCWLAAACAPGHLEPRAVVPPGPGTSLGAAWRPPPSACPMAVEGTSVLLVPIDGGAALVFTSSQSSPEVLRRAVLHLARQYQSGVEERGAAPGTSSFPAGVPTHTRYAETIAGARVEVRPQYGAHLRQVQAHLRRLASSMRERGSCHAPAAGGSPAPAAGAEG